MSNIEKLGKEGEEKIRLLLKKKGYIIQSPDWLACKNGEWICIEVKRKARFTPPPFEGHGLNKSQIFLRNKLFGDTKIRTFLIVFEIGTDKMFGQWLDELEKGKYFDTKNQVRIYPLKNFKELLD